MVAMDKDRLAAFVDGELSPEEAAAVAMHLADHPADQAYVDDLFAANEALLQAFSAPLHAPVPEAIRAVILGGAPHAGTAPAAGAGRGGAGRGGAGREGARVVALRPRAGALPRRSMVYGGLALAASAALAALLLPGLLPAPQAQGVAIGPLAATNPVVAVLDTAASGAPETLADGRDTMVLASFAMPDGRFCREIEVIDAARGRIDYALGCTVGPGWTIEAAIAEVIAPDSDGGYVPAEGGSEVSALTRFLERAGSPQPLDPAREAEAIRHGWQVR